MKSPLPKNRLVAITLLGALMTAGAAVALAAPDLLPGDSSAMTKSLPAGAPTPNADFQPAVKEVVRHHDDDDRYEHEDDDDEYEHRWYGHEDDD